MMNDNLKAKLYMMLDKYRWEGTTDDTDKVITQIGHAYQEEQHTNALIWYTRLTNDLINDDGLKRSEHVGRILEYARIAAGLSEEDVKITLPDKFIPHDPDTIVEHISPVLEVHKPGGMIDFTPGTFVASPDTRYLRSGKQWLTRFTQELDTDKHLMTPGAYKHALEIARRAAGI